MIMTTNSKESFDFFNKVYTIFSNNGWNYHNSNCWVKAIVAYHVSFVKD